MPRSSQPRRSRIRAENSTGTFQVKSGLVKNPMEAASGEAGQVFDGSMFTHKRAATDWSGGPIVASFPAEAAANQAFAVAFCTFLTISSWKREGSFWYLRNSMLKEPLPWVALRRSLE